VENQMGGRLKELRSDNGVKYTSKEFSDYLKEKRIHHQRTTLYTQMQNGIIERMNQTLQERVTTMLQHAGLTLGFWAEAVNMQYIP
jgi:transposase InsO family protein